MRFVVCGAGAIGSVVGARLHQGGHAVVLVARGPHLDALRERGLRIEDPERQATLKLDVVGRPADAGIHRGDVVLLAVKSHQTVAALQELRASAPGDVPVVCLQNGVENERAAFRLFANVYGAAVLCPAAHLEPGVVQAYAAPTTGILDVGRYPEGIDDLAGAVAAALRSATFDSKPQPDIQRWKYGKLLDNLGNALEAFCGPAARRGAIGRLAREEGVACLRAARIEFAPRDAERTRAIAPGRVGGRERPGGSTWQSLARGAGSVETDYLNGEVVLLGRLHGVPTPVNELLQRLANEWAREGREPGTLGERDLLARLAAGS